MANETSPMYEMLADDDGKPPPNGPARTPLKEIKPEPANPPAKSVEVSFGVPSLAVDYLVSHGFLSDANRGSSDAVARALWELVRAAALAEIRAPVYEPETIA